MSAPPANGGVRNRRRRGLRVLGALAVLAVLGLVALYLARDALVHPWVAERARRYAAEHLDAELEVGRIRSDWLGQLTLEDVHWRSPSPPLLALDASSVTVDGSPLGALLGRPAWLRAVRARVERLELAPAGGGGGGAPAAAPERLPAIDLELATAVLHLDDRRTLSASAVRLRAQPPPEGSPAAPLDLLAGELRWLDASRDRAAPLSARGRYAGGRLELDGLEWGETLRVDQGRLDLSALQQDRVAWNLSGSSLGGSLSSTGELDDRDLELGFEIADLDLQRLDPWLPGVLPADLNARGAAAGELSLDLGGERPGALHLRRVELVREGVLLGAEELEVPLASADWTAIALQAKGRLHLASAGPRTPFVGARGAQLDHRLDLTATLDTGRATLQGTIGSSGGSLRVQRGEVALGREPGRLLEDATLDVLLDAEFADLAPLASVFGVEGGGSLAGVVDLHGSLLAPTGRLRAHASAVRVQGLELPEVDVELRGDRGRVDVERCEVAGAYWRGSLVGGWIASTRSVDDARVSLELDAGERAGCTWSGAEVLAELSGTPEALAGTWRLSGHGLAAGPLANAELAAEGRLAGPEWTVAELTLADADQGLRAAGRVSVRGSDFEGRLESLRLERGPSTWELERAADFAVRGGRVAVPDLALRSTGEGAAGRLVASIAGDLARVEVQDFDLAPLAGTALPPGFAPGRVRGVLSASLGDRPALAADLHWSDWVPRPGMAAGELAVAAEYAADGVVRGTVEGGSDDLGTVRARVAAPYDPATFFAAGEVALELDVEGLRLAAVDAQLSRPQGARGKASAHARLEGSWDALRGTVELDADEVSDPEIEAALGGPLSAVVRARFADAVIVERAELRTPRTEHATFSGRLETPLDLPRWIADPQQLLAESVDIEGSVELPLDGWASRVPTVRRLGGLVAAQGSVRGTLARPRFTGDLRLTDGELRLTTAFPALRGIQGELSFEGRRVTVTSLTGEIGAAPCRVAGSIELDDGGPVADLRIEGSNLLLARSPQAKVRADASIQLTGPLKRLVAAGDVTLTEGRLARDVDVLGALMPGGGPADARGGWKPSFATDPPLADMRFDLRVRSSGTFVVKGNLYHLDLRPDLTLRGTGAVPTVAGTVFLEPSTVRFPSGLLRIRSGLLQFREDRPFETELALNSSMRARGYDIEARITGPVGDPEILLSSQPGLPADDLLVLFLTGQAPQKTGSTAVASASAVGAFLARDYLTRMLAGDTTTEDNPLDHLVVELGAEVSASGAPTVQATYYLRPITSAEGRVTYLLAERDDYDKTNFGFGVRFRFE